MYVVETGGQVSQELPEHLAATKGHVVCAMFSIASQGIVYCLDTEETLIAPSKMYRVVDDRISRHWHFAADYPGGLGEEGGAFYWGYVEFARRNEHREQLFELDPSALRIFEAAKEILTLEYQIPSIVERATELDNGWIMCALCRDGWKPVVSSDEMLRCPSCKGLQRRPQFTDSLRTIEVGRQG